MQLIVLGMHRSGTSAITRLINMMGVYFGAEGSSIGANEHNAKGFWERRDVMTLNMALLNTRRCTWFDLANWPLEGPQPPESRLAIAMKSLVLELDAHRPWVLKDPRMCLTLGDWLPRLEAPLAVIASRDPLEVARSLQQRDGMSIAFGLALWEHYAVHTIRNATALPKVFVAHEAVMAEPVAATRALHADLLANDVRRIALPSDREILAFVEPKLHRARRDDVAAGLSAHQTALQSMLRGQSPMDAAVEVSAESRDISRREAPLFKDSLAALIASRSQAAG